MSKKQKAVVAESTLKSEEVQDQITEGDVVTQKPQEKEQEKAKETKVKDKDNKKKKVKKEKKDKKSFGRKIKETTSELKKVTWPTFGEVCKKTGIVVAFVLICGVFLFGLNYLLGGLVNLLINGSWV